MKLALVSVASTILGVVLVQIANGFLGTLVAIRASSGGFSPLAIGLVLAGFSVGYTAGAAFADRLLRRVGHIRLFAALAGLIAASSVMMPILESAPAWLALRIVMGFGFAGLFVTAESWLNGTIAPKDRGTIFAVYMVATGFAFGAGQFLINLPAPLGYELFSLAAALFCLALVPVAMTRSVPPAMPVGPSLSLARLREIAPVSVAGSAAAGLAGSAFYGLVPAYATSIDIGRWYIAGYVATAVMGGLAFQVPVARLSDRLDRRFVAAGVAAGMALSCLALMAIPLSYALFPVTFLFGGFLSTIYPVCVAHANDRAGPDQAVAVSGQLILVNGLFSAAGPIIGTGLMGETGFDGVFALVAAIGTAFMAFAIWRALRVEGPEKRERPFVILNERMSQTVGHVASDPEVVEPAPVGAEEEEAPPRRIDEAA
ncbi:MFS transporter [Salinarimonas ramus]|uniref:MFS transporter n=1 Tax=Salinarimonas ramus TaxID=690164 RepID=A0A917Q861_9HYPH|nr:MFS transporter [Salinarimonas ramus]GGK35171.1 MFS transporter [Salinarimonas ramus]